MLPSRFSSLTVSVLSSSRAALAYALVMPIWSAKYTDICASDIDACWLLVGCRIQCYEYREQVWQIAGEKRTDGEYFSQQRSQETSDLCTDVIRELHFESSIQCRVSDASSRHA